MTIAPALAAALASGLLGSLHCAAMCGPLAVAGCSRDGRVDRRAAAGYFAARTAAYAGVGGLMGAIGEHALCRLPMGTVQTVAGAGVAAALGVRGVGVLVRHRWPRGARARPLGKRRPSLLARVLGRLPRRGALLGAVTAILPCGMLVPAWLIAGATASPLDGALVMLAFSAASAPGLIAPLAGRRLLDMLARRVPASVHGLAWIALALWVVMRPLLNAAHQH